MADSPQVITSSPLQPAVSHASEVIFSELRYATTKAATLVCIHHPATKSGGSVILLQSAVNNGPKRTIEELIELLGKNLGNTVPTSELQVKIVGASRNINAIKPVFAELGMTISGELKDDTASDLHAYFYTDSGRLRVGPAVRPTAKAQEKKEKARVLIVDDSKTIRQLLSMLFSNDPELEVVGAAELPSQAARMIEELKPDVITLDIHMPEMSGVELLQRYLPQNPIPTVMISSISMEEGTQVLHALELGAVDYIQKPSFEELDRIAPLIVEKVKIAAKVRLRKQAGSTLPRSSRLLAFGNNINRSIIVAIGASTGGTEALRNIFTRLPAEIPPIIVVQHIPPIFSRAFANRIAELCPFEVKEAEEGDEIRPNRILIAPGGLQMGVEPHQSGYRVRIKDDPPVNRHKPSVDYMFDSVAKNVGRNSIGIIMTGMGRDGAAGLLKMKQAGARTLAQDEASCVVYGMPKEAVKIGAADVVKPLADIAEVLMKWAQKK